MITEILSNAIKEYKKTLKYKYENPKEDCGNRVPAFIAGYKHALWILRTEGKMKAVTSSMLDDGILSKFIIFKPKKKNRWKK